MAIDANAEVGWGQSLARQLSEDQGSRKRNRERHRQSAASALDDETDAPVLAARDGGRLAERREQDELHARFWTRKIVAVVEGVDGPVRCVRHLGEPVGERELTYASGRDERLALVEPAAVPDIGLADRERRLRRWSPETDA